MRFASSRSSRPHLRELVAALDDDDTPTAATWRLVGETAAKAGLPRPSYPHVRRLVAAERRRRRARNELRDIVKEAANTVAAGRVPNYDYTLAACSTRKPRWPTKKLVFQKHKPSRAPAQRRAS